MCAALLLAGVGGAGYPCLQSGRLPQIIRISDFHAWLFMIGAMLCVPSCYWLAWVGQVVRGKEHVCSPGRLPQIIRIGKFHAWLLVIGGMLCVPSCYWLAWVGQVILVCLPSRLPQIIKIGKYHARLLMIGGI